MKPSRRHLALLAALVTLLVLSRVLPVGAYLALLTAFVAKLGAWGPPLYVAVYVVATLAFFPAALLTATAGVLFGPVVGGATVTLAATTAASLGFLLARYGARDAVEERARRSPLLRAVDGELAKGGVRVVALLRFSLFPFALTNYTCGLSAIRFVPFVATSAVCMLPVTAFFVTLGHVAGAAAGGAGGERRPVDWVMLGVGLVATAAVVGIVSRAARGALRERTGVTAE